MTNTSATGGYIQSTDASINDDALEDLFQQAIAGVSGIPGDLVRLAYQENPPARPDISVNWCGVSVVSHVVEAGSAVLVLGEDGAKQTRHEAIEVRCSFYGPSAKANAASVRDGFEVSQNSDALRPYGIKYRFASQEVNTSEEVNKRYYKRSDITLTFGRETSRDFPILTFVAAEGEISTPTTSTNWAVSPEV